MQARPKRPIQSPMTNLSTSASPASKRRVSPWWRALAILLALLLLVGGAASVSMFEQFKAQIRHLQGQIGAQPRIDQIALLLDERQQPAMLVTVDPNSGVLQLERLNAVREGQEDSMQLWALNGDKPPRSLGVIASKVQTPQLPLEAAALAGASELAISVEDKGGVAESRGPRLPWLFKGWLVRKAV